MALVHLKEFNIIPRTVDQREVLYKHFERLPSSYYVLVVAIATIGVNRESL